MLKTVYRAAFLSILSSVLVGVQVFANSSRETIELLIEQDLTEQSAVIQERSRHLSLDDRSLLYEKYKKETTVPVLINAVTVIGIGSYVQGDLHGGLITTATTVGGTLLATIGMTKQLSHMFSPETNTEGDALFGAGSLLLVGGYLFSLVRPMMYSSHYNGSLKKALHSHSISYHIVPMIQQDENSGSLASSIQFVMQF